MRNSVKVFIASVVSAISMLVCTGMYAQVGFPVRMKLSDRSTGEPVGFATVSMTLKGAKEPLKYVMSTEAGEVDFEGIVRGTYIMKAELMGYKPYEQEISVDRMIDLGTVQMSPDVEMLDAASVTAVGNPIIVKKDTIEYSATSFKTSDNDMLEELLKKLPGVEVGTDGSITASGETITKVMIDGKEFFLDDPQLATKNIPAKIIEKVRVVEKKSDQAEFTGIDDGEEETVIDLSVKPGMMDGWFGNVMAGGGHDLPPRNDGNAVDDWRYQGAAMVGRFTQNSQISIILNGNNTNNRGFNDIAGSMMQNMRGSRGMGRRMGGWGRNGITTSWMAGANGAFNLLDGNMELNGNYMYGGSDRYIIEKSSEATYNDNGSVETYNEDGENLSHSDGHRFGVRLEHKFSENTSILFEPQFDFGTGRYTEDYVFDKSLDGAAVNEGFNRNTGSNSNWRARGFLLFRQRLGKPGRTVSVMFNYSFSNNDLWGFNQSLTRNLEGETPLDDIVNQRYDQNSRSSSLSGRVVYTEPLGHDFYLEANYSYGWNRSKTFKSTYNSGGNPGDLVDFDGGSMTYDPAGETFDKDYSNDITNRYVNQSAGLNFMYQKEKLRAQLGAAIRPTDTDNMTNGESYKSNVINWSPQAMLRYDPDDNTSLRLFYFGRSSQPSTSQLMPVLDNSNPVNVSLGNPYLIPYFNHNIRAMFGYTDTETFMSIHGRFGSSIVQDPIVNAQWNNAGVRYSIPVNGPASVSVDGRVMINSPFSRNSKFSIFSMTYARFNESTSYIQRTDGGLDMGKYGTPEEFNYDLFHEDFSDMKDMMFISNRTRTLNFTQRLRFTFRNDFVELNLGGRTRVSKSWYSISEYGQSAQWNNQIDASMNWTIPGGVSIIADCDYNWYNGYSQPQDDEFVLNAEVSKLLFKDRFTLALKAYDILCQSKNLSVSDESNMHVETLNNTLGRYIILSLTWRFGNFGGPGGGPGHRGPMGPPHRR